MMQIAETSPETFVALKGLIIKALEDREIAAHFKFQIQSTNDGDFDYTLSDLEDVLSELTAEQARDLFRKVPAHAKIMNLAGLARGVHEYFYEFADKVDDIYLALLNLGCTGEETTTEVKRLLGLLKDAPEAPNPAETLAVDIRTLILDHVANGQIRVASVRADEDIFGNPQLQTLSGQRLAEKIRAVVGEGVEVVEDHHSKCVTAITDFVDNDTPIPAELLDYMKANISGGKTIAALPDWKIAQLYVNQNAITQKRLVQWFSTYEHDTTRRPGNMNEAGSEAHNLGLIQATLEELKRAGRTAYTTQDFPESVRNMFSRHYSGGTIDTFPKRLEAFLRSKQLGHLLEGLNWAPTMPTLSNKTETQRAKAQRIVNTLQALKRGGQSVYYVNSFDFDISGYLFRQGYKGSLSEKISNFLKDHHLESVLEGMRYVDRSKGQS